MLFRFVYLIAFVCLSGLVCCSGGSSGGLAGLRQ